jgi:hypothetical protein
MLIVEASTAEAVERVGRGEPSEYECESGLFSDRPHCCRTENRWLPAERVAVQTFTVTDLADGSVLTFRNATRAWPDADLIALLTGAGLQSPTRRDDWPCNTDDLALWLARRDG